MLSGHNKRENVTFIKKKKKIRNVYILIFRGEFQKKMASLKSVCLTEISEAPSKFRGDKFFLRIHLRSLL